MVMIVTPKARLGLKPVEGEVKSPLMCLKTIINRIKKSRAVL